MATDAHGPPLGMSRRLGVALGIAVGTTVVELLGSRISGSLALLSDAGHVGADAIALSLSFAALQLSGRRHTPRMSFGWHRTEVLTALVNAILLVAVASVLTLQAYGRYQAPEAIRGDVMFGVGVVGLGANLAMVSLLGGRSRRNINIRGAFLHAYFDALGSVGVVTAAVLVAFTGQVLFDLLIALFIVVVIVVSAVRLLRDSVRIILEASPLEVSPEQVAEAIRDVSGVRGIHDLHLWTVTLGLHVLTAHVSVSGDTTVAETAAMVNAIQTRLRERFGIAHVTLQVDSLQEEMIPAGDLTARKTA